MGNLLSIPCNRNKKSLWESFSFQPIAVQNRKAIEQKMLAGVGSDDFRKINFGIQNIIHAGFRLSNYAAVRRRNKRLAFELNTIFFAYPVTQQIGRASCRERV